MTMKLKHLVLINNQFIILSNNLLKFQIVLLIMVLLKNFQIHFHF